VLVLPALWKVPSLMYVKDGIEHIKARFAEPMNDSPLKFQMKEPHLCQRILSAAHVVPIHLAETEYAVDPSTHTISVTAAADRRIRDTNMVRFGVCTYCPSQ
jgi:hypothetical protein